MIDDDDHILRPFDSCEAITVRYRGEDCRRKVQRTIQHWCVVIASAAGSRRSHGGFHARRFLCCSTTTWLRCAHISAAIEQANASRSISCAPA